MNTEKVIAQAKSWLGINETDGRFSEIIRVYNEIPGARGPALASYPWCAIYVSAVYWKAVGESRFAEMACDAMIQKFQELGLYSASGYPEVGDVIFYDWDSNGTSDHVGIITEVADNGYTVIEGNKSDAVGYRTIAKSYPYIKGFGFASRLNEEKPTESGAESTNGQASNPSNFNGSHASEPIDNGTQSSTVGQQMAQHIIASRKYPTIKYGDTGDAVMFAQAILVRLGYLNKGKEYANVDGDFGVLTKSATLGFQSSTKDSADPLEIDGIIGKKTWAKLLGEIKE